MKISYNWLKEYIVELPPVEEVVDGIIFHSFEVEGVEDIGKDKIMEIKVLPDRAHDCLCHYGVAKEVAAIFSLPIKSPKVEPVTGSITSRKLKIKIEDSNLCRRYIGRVVEGVRIGPSPEWLASAISSIGQRSISNMVDASNYVMLDVGQPLHVFDADKVVGDIEVRLARPGEKMLTLDNRELELDAETLVIADEVGPLALAGIKGGKRAEVTAETKNIILESANFDPVNIRRTSNRLGLRTDASKRFENNLSPAVADYAMDIFTRVIMDIAGSDLIVGEKIDVNPNPPVFTKIVLPYQYINERLGLSVAKPDSVSILRRLGMEVTENGDNLEIVVPVERIDLTDKENIVEEVGRIVGYDKIISKVPEKVVVTSESLAMKRFRLSNLVRQSLIKLGFSEVYGYTFTNKGYIEVVKPIAEDKAFLRSNLSDKLIEMLESNLNHVLFEHDLVKIFELGKSFEPEEKTKLAIGVAKRGRKKKDEESVLTSLIEAVESVAQTLDIKLSTNQKVASIGNMSYVVAEFDFDQMVTLSKTEEMADLSSYLSNNIYKVIPSYPRIIRDVAVWVPTDTKAELVEQRISDSAGPLLDYGPVLFDTFEKDGRKSLAFRLVLQSYEKTLSDSEANAVMDNVIKALENMGLEVRK